MCPVVTRETCWTLIDGAAAGDKAARDLFVERYLPAVRAYLHARWHDRPYATAIDDAQQEVFLQCFRDGGVLARADKDRAGGFRAFLYGVVQRIAQAFESRLAREWRRKSPGTFHPERVEADEASLSKVFDRSWAEAVIGEAGELHEARARERGGDSARSVELLRLRFQQGMPIRDIARLWGEPAEQVHRAYARARAEFRAALRDVLGLHERCPDDQLERECNRVLELLR